MAVPGFHRLALIAVIGTAAGCGGDQGEPPRRGPRPFPVEVATVESRPVEYGITGVGGLQPFEEISVTARVSGVVEAVRFREGDTVKKDQELAAIEPDRFRIALQSARATLARV